MDLDTKEIAKQIYKFLFENRIEDARNFISDALMAEKTEKIKITKTPLLNSIGKELGKLIVHDDWKYERLLQLWNSGRREEQLIVISALGYISKKNYEDTKNFVLEIVDSIGDWEICDQMAIRTVVNLVVANSDEMFSILHNWVTSQHVWTRRLAIATVPPYIRTAKEDSKRCLDLIEKVMQDSEKDVKKAAGWALREVSKKDPEAVFEFLRNWAQNDNRHTRWIIKDGMKKLSKEQQNDLLQLLK